MNSLIRILTLGLALALALFPAIGRAQTDDSASFQTFYDQLASQGTWIQTQGYGYVWQPTETDPNWRPYMYGYWVNTDQGLTWVSDESFGWATYHYGRWVNLDGYGWVWVPGYTWAPAWVSWRDDADDVGWAPLPPDSDVGIDYFDDDDYFTDADLGFGYHIGDDCDLVYGIGPGWYNFCPIAYIGDRDAWRHFYPRGDNYALAGRTHNVTNINYQRNAVGRFGHVTVGGPSVAALNAQARTVIPHEQLAPASNATSSGVRGDTLAVYAPRIDPATRMAARPASVGESLGTTAVNRGTDVNRPLAINSRVRGAEPTSAQVRAATAAEADMPDNARVATADTHPSRPLTQSLTSMRADTGRLSVESIGSGRGSPGYMRAEARGGESTRSYSDFSPTASVIAGENGRSSFYNPAGGSPYYHTQPRFQGSVAGAYRPESSFHSFTPPPAAHFESVAPTARFSGGGFSGGARSYGGGGGRSFGGGASGGFSGGRR